MKYISKKHQQDFLDIALSKCVYLNHIDWLDFNITNIRMYLIRLF
jgi:hypothetical protein